MSEEYDLDELSEHAIIEALQVLEADASEQVDVSNAARAYVETLGALPSSLEPIEPSPAVKEAIMARIVGVPDAEKPSAPIATRAAGRVGVGTWMWRFGAVAAMLLLVLSVRQSGRITDQEAQIDFQATQIAGLERELADLITVPAGAPDWMAAAGTELCELRPRRAAREDSKGWLFVRQDHQHWYVAVEGLAPSPEGHVYQLWFLVDGKMVSGGVFEPDVEGRAVLTSETMPNPVTGIAVTLELDNGDDVPSEEMVLYCDEVMLTL